MKRKILGTIYKIENILIWTLVFLAVPFVLLGSALLGAGKGIKQYLNNPLAWANLLRRSNREEETDDTERTTNQSPQ